MNDIEVLKKTYQAYLENNKNKTATGIALGLDRHTIARHIQSFERLNRPLDDVFAQECAATGTIEDDVAAYWIKTENVSMFVKRPEQPSYEEIREQLINEMKTHAPKYNANFYSSANDEHLLIIDPADVHIGKLVVGGTSNGEYNIKIATERLEIAVQELVEKASVFELERIVLVIGNDILHVDNNNGTTTRGTRQDTDGKFWQMFLAAKKAYVNIIERLVQTAPVTVMFNPSNHDYASGWMLADTVYSWFNNHPDVSFGDHNHNVDLRDRKYLVYGDNLIGFTHGDGAKEHDLQHLMQYEARQAWGQTKFAYMYSHHLHHKIKNTYGPKIKKIKNEKDHPGITIINTGHGSDPTQTFQVEIVRSPSPSDDWHTKNGYVNHQAIEAFLHHPKKGQVARFTEFF